MLQETHIKYKDPYMLKVKQLEKLYHANISQKKSGMVVLISRRFQSKDYYQR